MTAPTELANLTTEQRARSWSQFATLDLGFAGGLEGRGAKRLTAHDEAIAA